MALDNKSLCMDAFDLDCVTLTLDDNDDNDDNDDDDNDDDVLDALERKALA